MQIKLKILYVFLISIWLINADCNTVPLQIRRSEMIGNYTYKTNDPSAIKSNYMWNHLQLQKNGVYILTLGGPTKKIINITGNWELDVTGGYDDGTSILLGNRDYPIEIKNNHIRILLDPDLYIWWIKEK